MDLHCTVAEVAALVEGRVRGPSGRRLAALRSLERAGPDDLAVVFRGDARRAARASRAGALLVRPGADAAGGPERSLIEVDDPEAALDVLAARLGPADPGPPPGVHPTAVVGEGARVDPAAAVGPWVQVGAGAVVGPRTELWAGAFVGAGATIGADGRLHPGVYVGARCRLGDRVIVHANAVLGADGFGFRQVDGRHVKSPQVGVVVVGDDVEIGAGTTIDRARLEATVIGAGCKLDDHVHVGHNCVLGEGCALAGGVGLAGGVTLGAGVLVGGQAGIDGGVTLGDRAVVGARAMVLRSAGPGEFLLGAPAVPAAEWKRQVLSLRRLPALIARVRALGRGEESGGA